MPMSMGLRISSGSVMVDNFKNILGYLVLCSSRAVNTDSLLLCTLPASFYEHSIGVSLEYFVSLLSLSRSVATLIRKKGWLFV